MSAQIFEEWIRALTISGSSSILGDREVLQFRLGSTKVYLVTGRKYVDKVLRIAEPLSSDNQTTTVLQRMASVTKSDINKFTSDTSGRGRVPLTAVPEEKRIWHAHHRLTMNHLSSPQAVQIMTQKFCELFSASISASNAKGEWETLQLYSFLKKHMASAAIASMAGTQFLEEHPDFINSFWKYDKGAFSLILGTPRFLSPSIHAAKDAFHEHGKYFEKACASFDWNGSSADADWEPVFGSKFSRAQARFLEEWDFEPKSRAGMTVGALWA